MELKQNKVTLLRRLLARELLEVADSVDYDYKTTLESLVVELTLEEYKLSVKPE